MPRSFRRAQSSSARKDSSLAHTLVGTRKQERPVLERDREAHAPRSARPRRLARRAAGMASRARAKRFSPARSRIAPQRLRGRQRDAGPARHRTWSQATSEAGYGLCVGESTSPSGASGSNTAPRRSAVPARSVPSAKSIAYEAPGLGASDPSGTTYTSAACVRPGGVGAVRDGPAPRGDDARGVRAGAPLEGLRGGGARMPRQRQGGRCADVLRGIALEARRARRPVAAGSRAREPRERVRADGGPGVRGEGAERRRRGPARFARAAMRPMAAAAFVAASMSAARAIASRRGTSEASPSAPSDHAAWARTLASASARSALRERRARPDARRPPSPRPGDRPLPPIGRRSRARSSRRAGKPGRAPR